MITLIFRLLIVPISFAQIQAADSDCERHLTSRAPFFYGAVASVAAHAGILYVLAHSPANEPLGSGGSLSEISIEVTIVPSSALETRDSTPDIAAGNPAPVAPADGQPEISTPVTAPPVSEPVKEPQPPEEISEIPALERKKEVVRPQISQPATGGAATRSSQNTQPKSGASKASLGAMQDYAREIVRALSRTKPKGGVFKGTVVVVFTVGLEGHLKSIFVAKTGGSAVLDSAALNAVRSAKFPPPPADMTEPQRTYKIPYNFL